MDLLTSIVLVAMGLTAIISGALLIHEYTNLEKTTPPGWMVFIAMLVGSLLLCGGLRLLILDTLHAAGLV